MGGDRSISHPDTERHEIERREGDCEHAEQDVGQREIHDEDVGHGLHVLVSDDDETDERISRDADQEDHDVETVKESFDRRHGVDVVSGGSCRRLR